MTLIDLIRTEARDESRGLIFAASVAGIANAVIVSLVSHAASSAQDEKLPQFIMIALAAALYVIGARRTFHRMTEIIELALQKMKLRIIDKIENASLHEIEGVGTSVIYDRLTENISVVSDSAGVTSNALQSLCIVGFTSLYMLSISVPGFVLLLLLYGIGAMMWSIRGLEVRSHLETASARRVDFLDLLTDQLKGFKELRFSRKRSRDLRNDMARTADSLRSTTVISRNLFNDNYVFAQCVLYALLVAVVFVLPQHLTMETSTITALVSAVLFCWGPLGGVVGGLPMYVQSNVALSNIHELEEEIEKSAIHHVPVEQSVDPWDGNFSTIAVQNVSYAYPADEMGQAFHIGPLNVSISRGEVVFIVGGNGSGKSTFVKVLTGLYPTTSGKIVVDGQLLEPANLAAYREMYSAIFSDFHLFARLYGLLDVEESSVRDLLQQMQLDDKTSFADGRFTKRDLSTGQRKRLAMIIALLEDRPICLFDEWAADQDPEFRKYFYTELIPSLKRRGKTVIAVSHDDRYFHCADRVVTLEYGKVRSIDTTSR